jgi:DNA-binding NtrC family response regulator
VKTILIIDDDDRLRRSFDRLLVEEGYDVLSAGSGEEGIAILKNNVPDTVVLDIKLPGMNGLEVLRIIHTLEPKVPVIMMTAFDATETGTESIRRGAFDYILKPFEIPHMLLMIDQAVETGRFMRSTVCVGAPPVQDADDAIIGCSDPMMALCTGIRTISPSDRTVLVQGEPGTGARLTARAVYQQSRRTGKPLAVINCRGVHKEFLERELFGYEKRAFASAAQCRIGKIEQVNRGTLFINGICAIPLTIQDKLLRLHREKSVRRIGGRENIPVDVRVIAASHLDMAPLLENVFSDRPPQDAQRAVILHLPPLRKRKQDIPLLADYFIARFAKRLGMAHHGITSEAGKMLEAYSWPRNIRELGDVICRAMTLAQGAAIRVEHIAPAISFERAADKKVRYNQNSEKQEVSSCLSGNG